MSEITNLSASQLISLYRDRQLSPVEVTKTALERIDTYNSLVNAFAIVDENTALAEAQASEVRWLNGNPLSFVDGIPFTAKDLLLTKGLPTRRGSKAINANQPWEEDAPAVARLRVYDAQSLDISETANTSDNACKYDSLSR
ncbi:amidase [Calothrix brevissima NIES-22]|nr:amidase [Calothrix brevissima NIES-22]